MNDLLTRARGPWIAPLLALLAGALLPFALAPFDVWPLALLSPALLAELLAGQTPGRAARLGWCYGIGLWGNGVWWLYVSIHDYGNTPAWLAVLMVSAVAVLMGLFTAVMGWLYRRLALDRKALLGFAPLFVLFEWTKTWFLTGFPWLFAGYAFIDTPLKHYAPVLGVFGLSLLAVISGQLFFDILKTGKRGWSYAALLAAIWGGGALLGLAHWVQPDRERSLSLSIVQGNIPQDLKWLTEWRDKTLAIYRTGTDNEWGRDLIVWPEAAVPMFQYEASEFLADMENRALSGHSTLVTGIPFADLRHLDKDGVPLFYNSLVALGEGYGLYFKQRLVPFGEYIPMEALLRNTIPFFSRDMSSFSAGDDRQRPVMVRDYRLGAAICYEVAYPELTRRNARDADFLVTLSNDGWFGHSTGPLQHLQMVRMRSLETGKWFVRATNTGVSAVINDQGDLVAVAPSFKRTVLRSRVFMTKGRTPFLRSGEIPVLALCGLALGLAMFRGRQAAKKA